MEAKKMYILKCIAQIGGLLGIALLGNKITQVFDLHFPGSILGILFIFLLLEAKIISLEWVETGANLLIAELILFFIPSAVGVVQYKQLIITNGASFGFVIFLSTVTVMVSTGLLAEFLNKIGKGR
jgi:holin-like protein